MPGSNIVASQGPPKQLKRHNYSFRFLGGGVTASQLYFEISRSIFVAFFSTKGGKERRKSTQLVERVRFRNLKIILLPILHLFRFWQKQNSRLRRSEKLNSPEAPCVFRPPKTLAASQ